MQKKPLYVITDMPMIILKAKMTELIAEFKLYCIVDLAVWLYPEVITLNH